ncbi:MAG: glycosyltransferase family 4 protein [Blastocatellales bacterium]
MRIVIDATAAVSGGKVYLDQLLTQFARLRCDHEFIIFHTGDFEWRCSDEQSSGRFQFRRVNLPSSKSRLWAGSGALKMLWRLLVLPLHLRRMKPELLFSNAGFGPGWKMARVKSVLALHNSMPLRDELIADETSALRRWRLALLRKLMRMALRGSDGSIVFSEDTKQRVIDCFDRLKHEPSVVYHGIDWGAPERDLALKSDELRGFGITRPYLLYVSQFHRYKNVLHLLEAFAMSGEEHPQLSLTLVGAAADKTYWQEVEAEVDRLKLRGRVKHIPACPRDQLLSLYGNALAFVHPSLAETCSFPLLEAMAMGVPIASARMSALPEIAGDASIYFDPHNPKEMAEALNRLVWDEALRDELSRRGIARAREFSWTETARKTLKVFEDVAGR